MSYFEEGQLTNIDKKDFSTHMEFLKGVKACIPTLLGYLSIGFAAGVVGKTAGLSIIEIALMCLLIYSGTAQFIAIGMITAKVSATAIIFTLLFVNLRHLLLSAALSPYFRHLSPIKNTFIGALLTDETFSVAMNEATRRNKIDEKWMFGLNITAYLSWVIANILGAFLGKWITDPYILGLDYALAAMFIGLLILQITSRKKIMMDLIVSISAALFVIGFSFITSGTIHIIFAIIVASTIGLVVEKWK